MNEFTSEILSSGIKVSSTGMDYKPFVLESSTGNCVYLTKSDINRLHGIAFPEKRHSGTCCVSTDSTEVDDINVADLKQTELINSPE